MDAPSSQDNSTPDNTPGGQTPPDAGTANPSPAPAPAKAAAGARLEAPDEAEKQAETAQAAPSSAPQPGAESAPKPTTPPPGAPFRKPDGDTANLTFRQQLEQAARQVDHFAKTAADSPLHYVALARYFDTTPQVVAAFPEEVKLRYAAERYDSVTSELGGRSVSPGDTTESNTPNQDSSGLMGKNVPQVAARGLTPGEIKLAEQVFGDSIDYGKVKIRREKYIFFQPHDRAMSPNGDIYFHPEDTSYSDDFSKEKPEKQGLLIHELTHVWQQQSGESVILRALNRDYKYDLAGGKSFGDYGIEAGSNANGLFLPLGGAQNQCIRVADGGR